MPKTAQFCVYGVLMDGTEEKFRFEFDNRTDAKKKAQELRNILDGVRYKPGTKTKYRDVIVKEGM